MKLSVTFKQQNPEFNKEYANEYHFGKESDGNRKDIWSRGLTYDEDIEEIKVIERGEFKLVGKNDDGENFEFLIPNMTILQGLAKSEVIIEVAVSKSLIKRTHKVYNEKYKTLRFYFYFKATNDIINPIDSPIYIDIKDLPKELLEYT
jgi:hypothetical protein